MLDERHVIGQALVLINDLVGGPGFTHEIGFVELATGGDAFLHVSVVERSGTLLHGSGRNPIELGTCGD